MKRLGKAPVKAKAEPAKKTNGPRNYLEIVVDREEAIRKKI